MCKVGELNKSEKSVVIKLKNGLEFESAPFVDDNIGAEMATNATEKELETLNQLKRDYRIREESIEEWHIKRKREPDTYYISGHAMDRLRERNGWNKKTAVRMVKKIIDNGTSENDLKGYLSAWIKEKKADRSADDVFIMYGDMFYIFNKNTLITCLYAPSRASVYR